MPPLSADTESISEKLQNTSLDLEISALSSDQQIKASTDHLEPFPPTSEELSKNEIKKALRLSLVEVAQERDLYEKKLKAFGVVVAGIGFVKKGKDRLWEDIGRLGKDPVDLKKRGESCIFPTGWDLFTEHVNSEDRDWRNSKRRSTSNFYGSVFGDTSVEHHLNLSPEQQQIGPLAPSPTQTTGILTKPTRIPLTTSMMAAEGRSNDELPEQISPLADDLAGSKIETVSRHDADLALQLQDLINERDLYEKKLKALTLVMVSMDSEIACLKTKSFFLFEKLTGLHMAVEHVLPTMVNLLERCLPTGLWPNCRVMFDELSKALEALMEA